MGDLLDLLNADGTEIEEQRVVRDPGATTGDVLTVNADKTISAAPGGGSQPITRATYDFTATIPQTNTATKATWAFNSGTALLDLTDPTQPTPVESGTYSFAAWASVPDDDSAPIIWRLDVTVDADDFFAFVQTTGSLIGDSRAKSLAVTLPFYVPAGSPCYVELAYTGHDPMAATGHVQLQRLS